MNTEITKTWADVKDAPGLSSLSIAMYAFGEASFKDWTKSKMELWHWERIVSIAETADKDNHDLGYSWVAAVIVDDEVIGLNPPDHLADLIAGS